MVSPAITAFLRQIRSRTVPCPAGGTDQQLLRAFCLHRDQSAFAALVQGHGPMVLRVCQRVLRRAEDAEDAFQATFLVLACRAGSIRKGESLSSWLHGVAYRIAVSARRSALRRQAREGQVRPRPPADPSWEAAWQEVQALLEEEISRLPARYRAPFVLCFLEGRSQKEVAGQLGLKEGTVWSRLARARQRLQQRLARRGITLAAVLGAAPVFERQVPAAVKALLAQRTVQAALLYAGGKSVAASSISQQAAHLARESLTAMFLSKLKLLLGAVAVVGLMAAGAGMARHALPRFSVPDSANGTAGVGQTPARTGSDPQGPGQHGVDRGGDPLPPGAVARLGTLRFHHRGGLRGFLAFSTDQKMLYSGATDGIVHVWDAQTGKQLRQFAAFTTPIGELALSPDHKLVAAVAYPRQVSLWDLDTGKSLWQMTVPESSVAGHIALAPDGRSIVSGGGNSSEVCLWETDTGQLLRQLQLEKHQGGVTRLDFSPDGRFLLSKTADGIVHFCNPATGEEQRRFPSNENLAPSYAFAPDGATFATGKEIGVTLWDLATGKERGQFMAGDVVGAVAYSPDGKILLAAGHTSLHFLDASSGKELHKVEGLPIRGAYLLRFSADGKTLATAGNDSAIHVWDVATGRERQPHDGHQGGIYQIAFSPKGRTLATVGADSTVRSWETATGRPLQVFRGQWCDVRCLAFSGDGRNILAGDAIGTVFIWDSASGKELSRLVLPFDRDNFQADEISSFTLSPDGRTLTAVGSHSFLAGPARVLVQAPLVVSWNLATRKQLLRREDSHQNPSLWALSPDGCLRASYNNGPISKLEETATGRFLTSLDGKCQGLWPIVFSADSRLLAGVCHHGLERPLTIAVWELATGKELRRLQTNLKGLQAALAFSPDGRMLAAGAQHEAGLHLWDLATGQEIARFCGFEATVGSLAFAPGGRELATGLVNSTALIWDTAPATRQVRARQKPPGPEQQRQAWSDLASEDAAVAFTALWKLAAAPDQAVPLLKDHLHASAGANPEPLERLITELANDHFATREKAARELEKLGPDAEPALRKALAGKTSAELGRRLDALLAGAWLVRLPDRIRELRAVAVLEQINTPEARAVVEALARGAPEARLTRQARAALQRMAK